MDGDDNVARRYHARAVLLLSGMVLAAFLGGCASPVPAQRAPVPAVVVIPTVNFELQFTERNIRKYIATFPAFIERLNEIAALREKGELPGAENRIMELSHENEEHVIAHGWSGMDGFVEFNRKMVHSLTARVALKRFRAAAPGYPHAKEQYRDLTRALERELGRDGLAALHAHEERILRMYRRTGVKELNAR